MAVALGGTLIQDIAAQHGDGIEHEQPTDPAEPWHGVRFSDGRLSRIYGGRTQVNSTHHQAVADPGSLRATGWAEDGIVEAVELSDAPFCVGVQWHPELLEARLFEALVNAAEGCA